MEQALVVAQPYSERPPRFAYELSESGRELAGALRLLADWGARAAGGDPYRHEACGGTLEARWYCPGCDEVVSTTPTPRTSSSSEVRRATRRSGASRPDRDRGVR